MLAQINRQHLQPTWACRLAAVLVEGPTVTHDLPFLPYWNHQKAKRGKGKKREGGGKESEIIRLAPCFCWWSRPCAPRLQLTLCRLEQQNKAELLTSCISYSFRCIVTALFLCGDVRTGRGGHALLLLCGSTRRTSSVRVSVLRYIRGAVTP